MNDNQIFLLKHINGEKSSLRSFLKNLTEEYEKPLSTLKHNARVLKELDLIEYGKKNDPKPVTLTAQGKIVLYILRKVEK